MAQILISVREGPLRRPFVPGDSLDFEQPGGDTRFLERERVVVPRAGMYRPQGEPLDIPSSRLSGAP
jgi:hypothetical protein